MRRTSVLVSLIALVGTALAAAPGHARQDPGFGQPGLGTCYRMSTKELGQASYGEGAVDCLAKHTSQVIGVTYLPGGLSWRKASAARLGKIAQKDCYPAITAALGGTVRAAGAVGVPARASSSRARPSARPARAGSAAT